MNRITVYINGNPGFKPAIITKLGRDWIHSGQDMDDDTISFPLPEKMSIEEFKAIVGIDIITDFGVRFSDEILVTSQPELPWKFIPARPFRMSVLTDSDPRAANEAVKRNDKSKKG